MNEAQGTALAAPQVLTPQQGVAAPLAGSEG